ncbi:hydantoinase B/oxoprolinase family protein [Sphingobium phenoxybenzoativorans]|uniref:Hydantoinase B/oxoprolinase family protein n=1 Tax=Sphingobium phenoxybenzoativorans TaxID=1592790 RepID=A0A975Q316_9SPHN|nr:hydantoinase B/oxoprolinase family protein [Sphingobium phenoxybenzoativorans]QUT07256.1 hydantoinase B/oxoprolinase family protein [Sphingobium phenoxybenzoativorans]
MSPLELEQYWTNLRSLVSERAKVMQRSAFAAVVREAGDLAYAVFDAEGNMVAQAETGTPGHVNCLEACGKFLIEKFAGNIAEGDVLITNDPWLGAGHYFDITILAPVFRNGKIIAYLGSTNHHADIGGLGMSSMAIDVHQEGLSIPPMKLVEAGEPNAVLYDIIRSNVRVPDVVVGDLAAQISSALSGGVAINEMCDRHGLDDIEELSSEIIQRSEDAMRAAIRGCPAGTWASRCEFELTADTSIHLDLRLTIDNERGEVNLDFTGSSDQLNIGVNVVENYARAYATFAVRSCLAAELPNNTGSLRPIKFSAPAGSIINCTYPAPVASRHVVGMYVPMPILDALFNAVPDRVLANGPGCPSTAVVSGLDDAGKHYNIFFTVAGGMGARRLKPGMDATNYPTGVRSTPVEMLEREAPIVFIKKELRRGSGGTGRQHGGDGQVVEFRVRSDKEWLLSAQCTALHNPPNGMDGGDPGELSRFLINGKTAVPQFQQRMSRTDTVRIETAGGAGFGAVEQQYDVKKQS